MPKRSAVDQISRYRKKIQKLQSKTKRRRRLISYTDSSDFEEKSDVEKNEVSNDTSTRFIAEESLSVPNASTAPAPPPTPPPPPPPLEPEILVALGELLPEQVVYGPDIHPDLAQRWAPILRKSLIDKDQKDRLFSEYAVPQNCKLFRAPQLNPEIAAAVSDFARARDKRIETLQQQLGTGLTAINRAISVLLTSDDKVQAIKCLSDASRILSDLHALETQTRIKSLTQGLDKTFLNLIQDCERDEMLFGTDLSEKIKASKAIEKQGSQIKKPEAKSTPGPSNSRSVQPQGNWRGTSRSMNRGGRGGARKTPYTTQRFQSSQNIVNPTRVWNRPQRAGHQT